jgi:hypothetical protein
LTTTATRAARRAGTKAARSDTVQRLARLGLAGRGLVYLVVAGLAANIARGSHAEADRQGALRTIGSTLPGRLALVVVAAGFAGYAAWRFVEATVRPGDKGVGGRVASFAKGCLYTAFVVTTLAFAVTEKSESGDAKQQDWTARVLGWPAGRVLVAAAGLALVGAGGYNAYRALSGRYRKHLKDEELSRDAEPWVTAVAVTGLLARGLAFALVGVFVGEAALRYDPDKARGLDGALRTLARAPYGRWLLLAVAVGLGAYGLWSFVEARYRRILRS